MTGVSVPIFMRLGNRARPFEKDGPKPAVGTFRNVTVSNVIATGMSKIGCSITGLPGHPIENVSLSDLNLSFDGGGTEADASRRDPGAAREVPGKQHVRHAAGLRVLLPPREEPEDAERPVADCASPTCGTPVVCDDVAVAGSDPRRAEQVVETVSVLGVEAEPRNLPLFWKSRLSDVDAAVRDVKKGNVEILAKSAGGRNIYLVSYGEKPRWNSSANYNSAVAGLDPASYARKDGTQRPVVLLLGPVHGSEFEGIVGLVNLLHVAETGQDLRGRPWKRLSENLAKCRVLIVPCGNPDGRARCRFDSWVGEELSTHERATMGTRPDGTNYQWPSVEADPPDAQRTGRCPGGLFQRRGRQPDARRVVRPDGAGDAGLVQARAGGGARLHRVAALARERSLGRAHGLCPAHGEGDDQAVRRPAAKALRRRPVCRTGPAGPSRRRTATHSRRRPFNLTSAMHHACGAVSLVFECRVGVKTKPYATLTHEQILDLQLLMADELLQFAVEHPVKWTR